MDKPDGASTAPASEPRAEPGAAPRATMHSALAPYLVIVILGLLAALIVGAQLWAYRDELRAILNQTPV